ncbi:MAG TPA: hypothetical protein VLF71_05745 [Candidatus Saccharimonadales bacterium]|nr:hypothetical protein [Candidatus Saccharimonadales bacterium]
MTHPGSEGDPTAPGAAPAPVPPRAEAPGAANTDPFAGLDIPDEYRALFTSRIARTYFDAENPPDQWSVDFAAAILDEQAKQQSLRDRAAGAAGSAATGAATKSEQAPAPVSAYEAAVTSGELSNFIELFPGDLSMWWEGQHEEHSYDFETPTGHSFYEAVDSGVGHPNMIAELDLGGNAPREAVAFTPLPGDMHTHVTEVEGLPKGTDEKPLLFTVIDYGITGKLKNRDIMIAVQLVWPQDRAAQLNEALQKNPLRARALVVDSIKATRARIGEPQNAQQSRQLERLARLEQTFAKFTKDIDGLPLPMLIRLSADDAIGLDQKARRGSEYSRSVTPMRKKK